MTWHWQFGILAQRHYRMQSGNSYVYDQVTFNIEKGLNLH